MILPAALWIAGVLSPAGNTATTPGVLTDAGGRISALEQLAGKDCAEEGSGAPFLLPGIYVERSWEPYDRRLFCGLRVIADPQDRFSFTLLPVTDPRWTDCPGKSMRISARNLPPLLKMVAAGDDAEMILWNDPSNKGN